MNQFFDEAIEYLFKNEGTSFVNNPLDSGGPTKWGVTQKAYSAFLGMPVSQWSMENMSAVSARGFYFSCYWTALSCDLMKSRAPAIAIFDTGVLYGVSTAAILAQKAIVTVAREPLKLDGLLGDKSLSLLSSIKESEFIAALHELILERIYLVIKIDSKNEAFRRGWTARADRLLLLARPGQSRTEVT